MTCRRQSWSCMSWSWAGQDCPAITTAFHSDGKKMSSAFTTRICAAAAIMVGSLSHPASAQSITDKMNSWLFGPPAQDNAATNANTPAEIDCPGVEVRQGASTLAISAPGAEAGPMTMRYQVTIGQTARE